MMQLHVVKKSGPCQWLVTLYSPQGRLYIVITVVTVFEICLPLYLKIGEDKISYYYYIQQSFKILVVGKHGHRDGTSES